MDFRLLTYSDKQRAKDIWALSFDDTSRFIDWFFDRRFEPSKAIGLFEDQELLAIAHMCPYSISVRGKTMNAPMIVGAATHPNARNRGLMAKLLRESYKYMSQEGQASILYPFDFGFYRKAGYHVVSKRLLCTFPATKLSSHRVDDPVKFCDASDAIFIHEISQRMFRRFDSHAVRSLQWVRWRMEETILDGGYVAMCAGAYAIYTIDAGLLTCMEVAYDSLDSLFNLLAQICEISSVSRVRCSLPIEDAPIDFFDDARKMFFLEPFIMLRVLDINWLVGMRVPHDFASVIAIEDPDGLINGTWRIRSNDNIITEVIRCSDAPNKTMSLREFTQAVVGNNSYFVDMY